MATAIERMYRAETRHFKSKQFQHCGQGGMEVHGDAPYYGWSSSLYENLPVGTWYAYEGKGLSGQGGNAQVSDRKKGFVVFCSVLDGMIFKANYIKKYNGNYARWFSTDSTKQELYKKTLSQIKAKFVDAFEAEGKK